MPVFDIDPGQNPGAAGVMSFGVEGSSPVFTVDTRTGSLVMTGGISSAVGFPIVGGQPLSLAVIGDSTARGVYSGDSEPGIDSATILSAANSWLTAACMLSGGKLLRSVNAGVIGNTLAQMDARVVADICLSTKRPKACAIVSGYNDAVASVTLASYAASLVSIVGKLRTYGITPILCTPLPTANNAAIGATLAKYSVYVRRYAALNNITLLDFQSWTMDSSTGGMSSTYSTGGDGVHPGMAGQRALGQLVSDHLTPDISTAGLTLIQSPLDTTNITPNGLFAGAPTAGKAPNVFNVGALPAGATASVVTDAAVPGSMQRVTHVATASAATLAQRITIAGKASIGDRLAISCVATAAGVVGSIWFEPNATPFTYAKPLEIDLDVTRALAYAEVIVPPGTTTFIDIYMMSGPGTGTFDVGQLSCYNLTTLGIV